MLDWGVFATVLPAVMRYAPCLQVGLVLGPSATGLYMLAARLAEALSDIFLAGGAGPSPHEAVQRACRVALPAVLASFLVVIALPSMLDLRWWGAVLPARVLLLGALPAALNVVCDGAESVGGKWRWPVVEALGILAAVALSVSHGLAAVGAATVAWISAMAIIGLWSVRRQVSGVLGEAVRPCAGAAAAGLLLYLLVDPVELKLASVPALCLLTAAGWLV